jgi:hypothetical protein
MGDDGSTTAYRTHLPTIAMVHPTAGAVLAGVGATGCDADESVPAIFAKIHGFEVEVPRTIMGMWTPNMYDTILNRPLVELLPP